MDEKMLYSNGFEISKTISIICESVEDMAYLLRKP